MKELTPSQKKAVYENPKNLQYLRKTHNTSKGAKTTISNKPWEKGNRKNINPNYKKQLKIKYKSINKLLKSNKKLKVNKI